jgi:signal transduction histidine kinase/ActR/RegA family two-component response regulator
MSDLAGTSRSAKHDPSGDEGGPPPPAWLHCTRAGRPLAAGARFLQTLGYASETEFTGIVPGIRDLFADREARDRVPTRLVPGMALDEVRWLRRDGTSIWVRVTVHPAPARVEATEGHLELRVHDVTSRRHLEEQLQQTQRLDALGLLAGGMAHDIGSLLSQVLAHADILETSLPDPPAGGLSEELAALRRSATTAMHMVRHLVSLSHSGHMELRRYPADQLIEEALRLIRPIIPERVNLTVSNGGCGPILVDPRAIERVLFSLVSNGIDAMPEGGHLDIRCETGRIDRDHLSRTGWGDPGEYGVLTVTDTGRGMEPGTLARLFEPFFEERKNHPRGGFGMDLVYALIKQHRGFVEVESEPGRGTTVRLYLRLSPETRDRSERHASPVTRATATILLVDDDEGLRHVTSRVLQREGYTVVPAASGGEALELLRTGPLPDLMITDIIMPGMNGTDLVRTAEEEGVAPRVLLTSGYRPGVLSYAGAEPIGYYPFVAKPWKASDLLAEVRSALADDA